jgi:zinc protease
VQKYFGTLKRGAPVPKPGAKTPPVTTERRAVVKDRIELPRVYMAWLTTPIFRQGDADADIAAGVLGTGRSSRLYKKLVYEKQIAQEVSAQQYSLILGSVFNIEVTARPGTSAEDLEKAINEELERFRKEGPDPKEVERARNRIESQIVQGLERLGGFGGVADRLNMYNHYLGTPDYLRQDIMRYRNVTPASVREFAQKQLASNARVVVHGVPGDPDLGQPVPTPEKAEAKPGEGAESINADEPWRTDVPKPGPARALQLPTPETFKLANGLTVIHNERPGLPVVAATLVFRTGSEANPPDKPGLANFTAAVIDEGTKTRSALQLADDVAQLGASIGTASSMDTSSVSVRSLKKTFPQALEIAADVVLNPTFPAEEIERQRKSRLGTLVQMRDNPQQVVGIAMSAALYGASHPYGYPEIGTEASNKAMTRDDMLTFWKQNYVPNNAALVVAGNVSLAELKTLAEKTFGSWQSGTAANTKSGAPSTTQARIVIVDKPGAQQTQLRVASIGVPRSTPDYDALEVMNNILGGLFSSRININLREKHGYTYGAGSQFVYRRAAGPFLIGGGIRTDVTAPAVSEIFKEVQRMISDPIAAEELALSKDSLVRSLPGLFEESPSAAATFANLFVYDLGLDYYARFPARVNAIDVAAVQQAAKKHVVPDKLIVVAVGDRAKIEPALRKLNLGTIELREADGRVKAATNP